jgi:glycosyltransferase involved in cell wall biosynthesis
MPKFSAVILTLNEERNIERCLRSLDGIADELLVVDSFSTDRTCEIARTLGARVIQQTFLGYIEQKNFALGQATYPHVISLDADEALSNELRKSVLAVKSNFDCDGYYVNRLTNYCGQWIRHCGWHPDWKMRLFDKRKGKWTGTNPHDRYELEPNSTTKKLDGDLLHYSYYTVAEHLSQIERFTDIAARAKLAEGKQSSIFKLIYKPTAKFIKSYFIKLGFLDGQKGWLVCLYSSYATYLRYRKMLTLQREL